MGCIFVINIHNNMKNSFLLVLLLLVGGAVSAQTRGSWLIFGEIGEWNIM